MTRTTLAVAADYADALLVARRAKNLLFLLLLLVLLLQVTVFVLYRLDVGHVSAKSTGNSAMARDGATASADLPLGQSNKARSFDITLGLYRWVINGTSFLGVALIVVLGVVLLLTCIIMLVGRLIGVSHLTSAFVWCVLLAVLLFPWQSLLNSYSPAPSLADSAFPSHAPYTSSAVPDQGIPGILMTWTEVERESKFETQPITAEAVLHWMRFAGWPAVAILLLMVIQIKGSRGLRFALGESDIPVEVSSSRTTEMEA